MIRTKEDLRRYMKADKEMLERGGVRPGPTDYVWKFERLLRRSEYWHNQPKTPVSLLFGKFISLRLAHMEMSLGFSIPLNVFDSGLSIAHIGPIIVSPHARVGKNCRIHVGVNIGTRAGVPDEAPVIGNDVYIGPGAKLFGSIEVADRIAVGANAVVNKSFTEPGISIGGVPAKRISNKGNPDYKGTGTDDIGTGQEDFRSVPVCHKS